MWKRLWYLLSTHFFDLLRANLLYVLFTLPVVTIPAAICGLYAVVLQYWRIGYGELFGVFWREFKANFFASLVLTLALVAIPICCWRFTAPYGEVISYVVTAAILAFVLILLGWLYPQLALLKLRPWQALRNAAILTLLETKRNFFLLLASLILLGSFLFLWPFSLVLLVLLLPVFSVVVMVMLTLPVLEERLVQEEK